MRRMSDHSGMADLFAGPGRRIYLGEDDLRFLRLYLYGDLEKKRRERYVAEGFSREMVEQIHKINPANNMALPDVGDDFYGLKNGEMIQVGEYRLQTVFMPGHTPGNTMFWAAEQGVMFSGDHILFDITPNITAWEFVEDSLGDYLKSLKQAKAFTVMKTLPGHRKAGDYHSRIDELLKHHQLRLAEALSIIREHPGLTAYDITAQMTWRIRARNWDEFPITQKWFAVGECLSHLDYLRKRERIVREMRCGKWRYRMQ